MLVLFFQRNVLKTKLWPGAPKKNPYILPPCSLQAVCLIQLLLDLLLLLLLLTMLLFCRQGFIRQIHPTPTTTKGRLQDFHQECQGGGKVVMVIINVMGSFSSCFIVMIYVHLFFIINIVIIILDTTE